MSSASRTVIERRIQVSDTIVQSISSCLCRSHWIAFGSILYTVGVVFAILLAQHEEVDDTCPEHARRAGLLLAFPRVHAARLVLRDALVLSLLCCGNLQLPRLATPGEGDTVAVRLIKLLIRFLDALALLLMPVGAALPFHGNPAPCLKNLPLSSWLTTGITGGYICYTLMPFFLLGLLVVPFGFVSIPWLLHVERTLARAQQRTLDRSPEVVLGALALEGAVILPCCCDGVHDHAQAHGACEGNRVEYSAELEAGIEDEESPMRSCLRADRPRLLRIKKDGGEQRARNAPLCTPRADYSSDDCGHCRPHSAMEEARECPICISPFRCAEDVVQVPCGGGHIFHLSCILEWLRLHRTCPCCRDVVLFKDAPGDADGFAEWMEDYSIDQAMRGKPCVRLTVSAASLLSDWVELIFSPVGEVTIFRNPFPRPLGTPPGSRA